MSHLMPSARILPLVDGALAVWVAVWIGLGVAIGVQVRDLSALSATVARDGRAVEAIGTSLDSLHVLPFVGGQISKDAEQVQQAGARAAHSGASSVSSVHALSILLAIAVALLPSVPVFGFYLPARVKRSREAAALRGALRQHGSDPDFEAFLARRAIVTLSYRRLRSITSSPWADLEEGRFATLAAAELDRLGIAQRLVPSNGRSRA